jgi:hypothetical protein
VELPPAQVIGAAAVSARVVLLGMSERFPAESWAAVERRVAAEMQRLGLETVRVPSAAVDTDARLAELGAQASSHRALAALRIVRGREGREAQLWVYDALTGKMLLRRTAAVASREGADAMVALRVVELLEASLIEIRMRRRLAAARPPSEIPAEVSRVVAAALPPPQPAPRPWRATAGLGLSATPGGAGPVVGVLLGFARSFRPWIALRGEAFLPVSANTTSVSEGDEADFRPIALRAGVELEPWSHRIVSPALGLGAGTLIANASGRVRAPAVGRSDWTAVALLSATLRAGVRLSPSLALVASATVGVALPEVEVHLGGEEVVTRAGRPLLDGAVGVEWRW